MARSEQAIGPFHRHVARLLPIAALAIVAAPAGAQTWHFTPSIAWLETLTDNVNLSSSSLAQSDLVTQVTPTLAVNEASARTSLNGTISVPMLLYARTGSENNTAYPLVNLLGNVEAVEKFLYVEGAINVSQQFLTPFGAQPASLATATDNRYTSAFYRVSPYIRGTGSGDIRYELRNNSMWSNLSGAPIATNNSYTSQWLGHLDSPVAPLGWFADLDFTDVKFTDQGNQRTNLARVGPRYAYDAQLQLRASAGYEENRYPLSSYQGAIYGAGLEWRPTDRTNVVASWEHRFFGSSYLFNFDHRTPLSTWNVSASRNITTYAQQVGTLPAGNVAGMLNQLLLSRIPDPAERQTAVDAIIQKQGLPTDLTNPVNLYTQEILLLESASATVGLLGARNNAFLTGFYVRTEPISGSGQALPPALAFGNNNTQLGANFVWTHNLTPMLVLNLTANALRTTANAPLTGTTNQGFVRLAVSSPLSANLTAVAGARYQILNSNIATDYREAAVFAGLNYIFR